MKTTQQVASRKIFPLIPGEGVKRGYSVPPPGKAKDPQRARQVSQARAAARVRDIALCNSFEYFFTWTLDETLIDRHDPDAIYPKVKNFLGNAVRRKNFAYVLVPEYHTPKAGETTPGIHMHGLCMLGSVPITRAATKQGRPRFDRHGRPVYHMPTWTWGFSTCVPVDQQYERAVNYIVKYIAKNDGKIFGKWYLSSRNLKKRPDIIPLDPISMDEFKDDYKLNLHIQNQTTLYAGTYLISEDFPALGTTT